MRIIAPSLLLLDEAIAKNPVQQLGQRASTLQGTAVDFREGRRRGHVFKPSSGAGDILIIKNTKNPPASHDHVVAGKIDPKATEVDLSASKWLRHPFQASAASTVPRDAHLAAVLESWQGAFSYVEEDPTKGVPGLRRPQIGAVHAVHAHWATSSDPATVVMPTGTGKTDTMLAIVVSARCERVLVVVPTDVLRTQIAKKFLDLGVLKAQGCALLKDSALFPVVCTLRHRPRSAKEATEILSSAHVIVTTANVVAQCPKKVQEQIAKLCPYLLIDEAHHTEAPTWSAFKKHFRGKRILQFTATPFREDGKPLEGKIVFRYPMRKAQEDGYFKPIRFRPVVEFDSRRADQAIAREAMAVLKKEKSKGHILMARVDSIHRAGEVLKHYATHSEFNPVELHTGIKPKDRERARKKVISGESRIVVCVDMLGEGFDLPELKIAAFHDIRKSLAVTLQLAGRFTRARSGLGDATVIANTADVVVNDELRKLYTRDPDWNVLLPDLSDKMIGEQQSLQEFLKGFTDFDAELPIRAVRPATSAVVYRTRCRTWTPENFREGIPGIRSCEQVLESVNHAKNTLVVVTARRAPLVWTEVQTLYDWYWDLYVVIWSPDQNLLFINSSTNTGQYRALAEAVAGDTAELIEGQQVFRVFSGVNRLRLQSVGLSEQLGRNVRYTGRMGSDIEPKLSEAQRRNTKRSVLSGIGYEGGTRTSIGASRKGRIWSHRRGRIHQLVGWCEDVGRKLLDSGVDTDEVLKGTLEARPVRKRPAQMPICIDWPEEIYTGLEIDWSVKIGGDTVPLYELDIEIVSPSEAGDLEFQITDGTRSASMRLELCDRSGSPDYRYIIRGTKNLEVCRGATGIAENAATFFYSNPPIIWFADGSSLEGNKYVELKSKKPPYDRAKISSLSWSGTDIKKESQGVSKDASTIQARMIRELKKQKYDVIFDDDGSGEAADIVAIRKTGDEAKVAEIEVEFYHCKYSSESTKGKRVGDLYEVCGQAQKSIRWLVSSSSTPDLFTHLMRRESLRKAAGKPSRFEVGTADELFELREMSRMHPVSLRVFIVQPGMSKAQASTEQLELLSVTENYLLETYLVPFGVIASS